MNLLIDIDNMNKRLGDLNLETGQFHVKLKGKEISMPLCHGERVTRNGQVADPGERGKIESDRFFIEKVQVEGQWDIFEVREDKSVKESSQNKDLPAVTNSDEETDLQDIIAEWPETIAVEIQGANEVESTLDEMTMLINNMSIVRSELGPHLELNEVRYRPPKTDDKASELRKKVEEAYKLNDEQRYQLHHALKTNEDAFSDIPGLCKNYVHILEVTDKTPYDHKSRIIPIALRDKVDQAIDDMLKNHIIEPTNSQYINHLCIVSKKDGSVRCTLDARKINARTVKNHFRTLTTEQLLGKFSVAKYFSTIDLSASFHQIELHRDSRDFTAFLHKGKQYRFRRCPFGLSSSGAGLLRAIDLVFGDTIEEFGCQFVDDFAICSKTFKDHIQHITYVLTKLAENGFTVKLGKSAFCKSEIELLGYLIDAEGIRANQGRVASITNYPPPRNVKQLRRFLGMCLYQSRFVLNYAQLVDPLRHILKKGNR